MVILLHSQVTLKCVGRVEIVEGYTSDRKRDLVNFWLLKLPAHAWVVYPDVDEFFTYPRCIIDLVSAGFDGHKFDGVNYGLVRCCSAHAVF